MTIDDIRALIAADESRTLELKKTTGELKAGGFVYVIFKRPTKSSLENDVPLNVPQNDNDVPQKTKEVLQDKIIGYIRDNSTISREDIAAKLNITSKTVGRYLAKIGIYWEGHPKTGHWVMPDELMKLS